MEEKDVIKAAVQVLRDGGVILYPTDTVWGLGCDATNPEAVAEIFAIKQRPDSKSLVLLASDMDMVCRYVKEVAGDGSVAIRVPLNDFCRRLVSAFGRPIVSTSANISGQPSPADFDGISSEVREAVDFTIDPAFGKGATGKASSIIKVGLDASIEIIRK